MTATSNTVLVAGGAGYVGAHACKALAAAGYTPVVFDNFSAGHRHNVRYGPLVEGDIRDKPAVASALRDHAPFAVMHFAASIEVGFGERYPTAFYDNNVGGVVAMLGAMAETGVNRFIFSSTCAVYGDAQPPFDEDTPRAPASVYARTKAAVEDLLLAEAKASGLRPAILRYFNASGADPEGYHGEEHDPETHLIPNALKAAAGLGGPMKLFGEDYPTPDGTCLRDYVHVSDLAEAHLAALERLAAAPEPIVCNLGTGQPVSVRKVLAAVEHATGRAVPHTIEARRPGDVTALYARVERARDLLSFKPKRSDIPTIIADAWAFHRKAWGLSER
ncbi:MAG: UDP-glucose 4-epimerase GalE [Maricaulaceae bacterium]